MAGSFVFMCGKSNRHHLTGSKEQHQGRHCTCVLLSGAGVKVKIDSAGACMCVCATMEPTMHASLGLINGRALDNGQARLIMNLYLRLPSRPRTPLYYCYYFFALANAEECVFQVCELHLHLARLGVCLCGAVVLQAHALLCWKRFLLLQCGRHRPCHASQPQLCAFASFLACSLYYSSAHNSLYQVN
jgi:hypothetical protein